MDDPIGFFGESLTQMHSIPRVELEVLQRKAMSIRFQQHRDSIEMLRKLADRLGITELDDLNDVVPLFFSHTAFKSYPAGKDQWGWMNTGQMQSLANLYKSLKLYTDTPTVSSLYSDELIPQMQFSTSSIKP